jgi:hypothetical protein
LANPVTSLTRRQVLAYLSATAFALRTNAAGAAGVATGKTRSTPLFKDIDDAKNVIRQIAIEEADAPLSNAQAEMLLSKLKPQFWIAPADASVESLGATRFGGAPDLAPDASWPLRQLRPDAEQILKTYARGEDDWLFRHARHVLPYEFLAQIDLAEAATHPAAAPGLPDTGRLLFFWDGVLGMYASDSLTATVIWDQTPRDQLTRLAIPQALHDLEKAYDPEGKYTKPYVYPARAMQLQPILHLPHTHAAEAGLDADLIALFADDEAQDSYRMLLANDDGAFAMDAAQYDRRQRFMGSPNPEQDDPRYDAIVGAGHPPPPWTGDRLRAASEAASQWQLLLQVDFHGISQQDFSEGTIYFLISKSDLVARDFARAIAVYQQT